MRKVHYYLFTMLAVVTLATSCKKDKHEDVDQTPRTEVPDAFVGKWIIGNVNPAHFADYSGAREDDMVNTMAYAIRKDGAAEQFIYIYEENSDKQTLTQRKGTMTYDEATATLKFHPTEGQYRIFQSGNTDEGTISGSGLSPTYAPSYRNCEIDEDQGTKFLVGINDYNETLGFAKATW